MPNTVNAYSVRRERLPSTPQHKGYIAWVVRGPNNAAVAEVKTRKDAEEIAERLNRSPLPADGKSDTPTADECPAASTLRGIADMNDKGPNTVGRLHAEGMRKGADALEKSKKALDAIKARISEPMDNARQRERIVKDVQRWCDAALAVLGKSC